MIISAVLLAGPVYGDFGFGAGPFSMEFVTPDGYVIQESDRASMLDSAICNAISNQRHLTMTVQAKDITSAKEVKVVTREITIEPYAYGMTRDGKPVLRGNVIEDKNVKEVTVTFAEDKFDTDQKSSDNADQPKKQGFFAGMFSSSSGTNVDISRVRNVQVVEGTHFDAPKDFKGFQDDTIHVVCELPIAPAS